MDSRAIAPVPYVHSVLGANADGFFRRINDWLDFVSTRTRGNVPLTGPALALTAYVTSLISGQNVISDNEREFVSLSRNTFEA